MSRGNRSGLQPRVARALGLDAASEKLQPQVITCDCGARRRFDTNAIGQLVELCDRCGYRAVYRGGPQITKASRVAESGATRDGEIVRRGPYATKPRK